MGVRNNRKGTVKEDGVSTCEEVVAVSTSGAPTCDDGVTACVVAACVVTVGRRTPLTNAVSSVLAGVTAWLPGATASVLGRRTPLT